MNMAEDTEELSGISDTRFGNIPIEITISIGMARPPIKDLLALEHNSVLPLDSGLDDPVDLFVGSKLIGRGQLEELDEGSGRLGVRITDVTSFGKE